MAYYQRAQKPAQKPVKGYDVEANLEYGKPKPNHDYGKPKPNDDYGKPKPNDDYGKPKPNDDYGKPKPNDDYGKPKPNDEPDHGLIPKEYRALVWYCFVGFVVCFLADFAARKAWQIYSNVGGQPHPITTPCWDFKLLFHCNITMGIVYGFVSLLLLTPVVDKLFYSLYWDKNTFPGPKTTDRAIIRQMALFLLAINIAQCIMPSDMGIGLVALFVTVMVTCNFVLFSCFNYYSSIKFWTIKGRDGAPDLNIRLGDFYFVSSILFTALFAVGLERTNGFNLVADHWKNDKQNKQTWLFYLNMVCGINYMIVGILNYLPIYNTWFMRFYFSEPPKAHSSIDFFHRNSACILIGFAGASLIAPQNPGVGVVAFWAHLLLIFWFVAGLCGFHGKIVNKHLWVGWLLNAILFTVLFACALKRLDDCEATDVTCGQFKDWTEQPWDAYKGPGNSTYCGQ